MRHEMDEVCDALGDAVTGMRELLDLRTDAEVDYKLANYRAFRDAEGTVEDRKAEAFLTTGERYRQWQKADNALKVGWAYITALRERLGKLRTEEATERELAGSGRHP